MRKRFSGSRPFRIKKAYNDKPKGDDHRRASDHRDRALAQALLDFRAQDAVDDRAEQGQEHDPANEVSLYRMIHLISQPLNF